MVRANILTRPHSGSSEALLAVKLSGGHILAGWRDPQENGKWLVFPTRSPPP